MVNVLKLLCNGSMCLDNRLKTQYKEMLSYVDVYVSLDRFVTRTFWLLTMKNKFTHLHAAVCLRRARFYSKADELGSTYILLTRSSSATRGNRGVEKRRSRAGITWSRVRKWRMKKNVRVHMIREIVCFGTPIIRSLIVDSIHRYIC